MLRNITKVIGGDPKKRELERLSAKIADINQLESAYANLTAKALGAKTDEFRQRLSAGETLDDLLPQAFATVREASKRTIGLRHFDIQLIGGIVLHEGKIAEMRTGEGKTLVATLPLYLNALTGKGVHLVTVNDYLARRDARWMAPIYHQLGLSVGVLQMSSRTTGARDAFLVDLNQRDNREEMDQLKLVPRKQAYLADITYGTNNEFGFDYLRDNLVMDIAQRVQRGFHYAIIDEVDNILIDEARTPLIISGPASEDVAWYNRMAAVVKQLEPQDYDFDEKDRSVALTEIGEVHVEELLKVPLRDPDRPEDITPEQARLLGFLEQALRAELLYRKNRDYIVQNGKVIIVDEFTGRLMPGRRWSEGLHQAVEAKEGVKVNPENVTHATITLQNYFRKYEKLAGMTGTAVTEAEEFSTIYDLDVIEIPTNLDYEATKSDSKLVVLQDKDEENYSFVYYADSQDKDHQPLFWKRKDYPDIVYRTEEGKLRAIALEILQFHLIGRPQLIGTSSIEHSEKLSGRLQADQLRRLLMTVLIRQAFFEKSQIEIVEKAYPQLDFLNKSLPELDLVEMRRFAHSLGLETINPESKENAPALLTYFKLDDSFKDRLNQVVQGGIPHSVLNALKNDQEAQIIANAGAFGAVTIATNMAGRGVDIKLGGEIEESILSDVKKALTQGGINPYGLTNTEMADALRRLAPAAYEGYQESVNEFQQYLENMRQVRKLGGLHVIGSERHEARRIDNQLRGRSGRQGDPGSSRFYLSLEDDLMRMFGGERAENMMHFFNLDPSIPLESKMLGRLVEGAQERVEGGNFDIRKHLLDYDDVLNNQREKIYAERDRVLVKKDLEEDVLEMLHTELGQRIPQALDDPEGPWKLLAFLEEIQPTIFFREINERVASYTMILVGEILSAKIKDLSDKNEVHSAALELAAETLEAERQHVLSQTSTFVQRTAESFQNQLSERAELLDIFIDNMEQYRSQSLNDFNQHLQNQLGLKVEMGPNLFKKLFESPSDARHEIQSEIERQLSSIFLSRLKFSIERRLGNRLAIDLEALAGSDWQTIEEKILQAVDQIFAERISVLTRSGNQIDHNIQSILKGQAETTNDLIELAAGMAVGTQVMINSSTHERITRRANLLNYVHLASKKLEEKPAAQISAAVLTHLESVQKDLRSIWGKMELNRLAQTFDKISDLKESDLIEIESNLEGIPSDELKQLTFSEVRSSNHPAIIDAFGKYIQTRIYRHILLREISNLWMEHLTHMEALRVSIRMEAYAQRDPLVQYKSVSSDTFRDLLSAIRMGVISKMFRMQPAKPQENHDAAQVPADRNSPQQSSSKKKRKRHKKR